MSRLYSCLLLLSLALFHLSVNAETIQQELVRLTNEYRQANGLSAIPISYTLTKVAVLHTHDMRINDPITDVCNMHSWSDYGYGLWTGCCYTADHAQAQCMWDKGKEISGGAYTGTVFENAAGDTVTTATQALDIWKGSPDHNAVILNQAPTWSDVTYRSIGASVCNGYAVLWFGTATDQVSGDVASLTCESVSLPSAPTAAPTSSTPTGSTPTPDTVPTGSTPQDPSNPTAVETPQDPGQGPTSNNTPQSTSGPSAASTPSNSPSAPSLSTSGSVSVCASIFVALAFVLAFSL